MVESEVVFFFIFNAYSRLGKGYIFSQNEPSGRVDTLKYDITRNFIFYACSKLTFTFQMPWVILKSYFYNYKALQFKAFIESVHAYFKYFDSFKFYIFLL